ncbi:hypothetical protein CFK37_15340 [Virgibacillus phasianinus]|uniref:YneQ n=1 Tax=Virgibacillus phasianinus TaxID=2017483 RepID=A0A220U628_9BACI|nr:hypothetical protein [Virgibacillus phasianinus]ASK63432.1 hypothetical protein CFK37_15340 [Virgibacillus phasianinus]
MAFGLKRADLQRWKTSVKQGNISFLTHYWQDSRFPEYYSVTKVGCSDMEKLITWGEKYQLQENWIHLDKNFPHFDLLGAKQREILIAENQLEQLEKFSLM